MVLQFGSVSDYCSQGFGTLVETSTVLVCALSYMSTTTVLRNGHIVESELYLEVPLIH